MYVNFDLRGETCNDLPNNDMFTLLDCDVVAFPLSYVLSHHYQFDFNFTMSTDKYSCPRFYITNANSDVINSETSFAMCPVSKSSFATYFLRPVHGLISCSVGDNWNSRCGGLGDSHLSLVSCLPRSSD